MNEFLVNELKRLSLKLEQQYEILEQQDRILNEFERKVVYFEACKVIGVENKDCLNEMIELLIELYVISEGDVKMQMHVLKLAGVFD